MANSQQEFQDAGFDPFVAEALAENERTLEDVALMSKYEVLDMTFEWHGFMGYTQQIMNAYANVGMLSSSGMIGD